MKPAKLEKTRDLLFLLYQKLEFSPKNLSGHDLVESMIKRIQDCDHRLAPENEVTKHHDDNNWSTNEVSIVRS